MTYLWQEEKGKKFYRVQTDDKFIADKLKRRNGFKLTAKGLNTSFWIFLAEFSRPDIARKTINNLTDKKAVMEF